MSLLFTKPDDSALTGISLTAERTVDSAHIELKIKNDGLTTVSGAFVTMYAETSPGSGVYTTNGQPVVDERLGRFEITGFDDSATPGQEFIPGVIQPMGHLAVALLPDILAGDWILADFWISQGSASAAGGQINIKLEVAGDTTALPLPAGVSKVGTGIDTGRKQARSFLISGREVTATGTPDDEIHVAAGSWLIEGEEYTDGSTEDVTLDQNDGNSDALATGESYIAVITQSANSTPTTTKGVKDTSPTAPTPPAGELILAFVTVAYNASASVIHTADIDSDLTYGRYLVVAPATGLSVTVHSGEAVIADFLQRRGAKGTVVLSPSVTNRIWLEWNGAITVNTSDTPPSAGAVMLAEAVTDGSNVTSLTDERTYINPIGDGVLEVKELDGSPDVTGVVLLKFPSGSLTDLGSGMVEVTFPTGGASASTSLTASEGVKRASGTDLSTNIALKLDVDGLTEDTSPDYAADFFPTFDDSAAVHKKVSLARIHPQEYTDNFPGDGVNQPATLSPVPSPTCIVKVYIDGLRAVEGGGEDYTDDGAGNIVFTPVLALGQKATFDWF